MITKHYCKSVVRAALLLALTICIIDLAPAFSTSALAGSGSFSINDVSGNYVSHSEGWYYGSGSVNYVPNSGVGLTTFTPATGTFHADLIVRVFGENDHVVVDGTYTVDANGHGQMTWRNGANHNDFYIVNGGAELKAINTDPPGTEKASNFATMTKQ